MCSRLTRSDAESALAEVRRLLQNEPAVLGTGLFHSGEAYVVKVVTSERRVALPEEIKGVPIVQEFGDPPQAW